MAFCTAQVFLMEGTVMAGGSEPMWRKSKEKVNELGGCNVVRGSLQSPFAGEKGEVWWEKSK